ncbi:YegP family protein [Maribacter confluentis]|uniref:YegP family protein n=1 Tax=Maribacter confluentis TaxID=1656093 RepID=A0ABT8RTY7_9FLAO|nr:YegP family protein [Maribacter confluentis]MDO1514402.1 YegP family protein [Maribacter confluentis]
MIKINKKKEGVYIFKLKSTNGRTLLKSVPFSSKDDLDKTLQEIKTKRNLTAKVFERKTTTDGKFLVQLKNSLGETIGSSGLYSSEAGMENGILNIKNSLNTVD